MVKERLSREDLEKIAVKIDTGKTPILFDAIPHRITPISEEDEAEHSNGGELVVYCYDLSSRKLLAGYIKDVNPHDLDNNDFQLIVRASFFNNPQKPFDGILYLKQRLNSKDEAFFGPLEPSNRKIRLYTNFQGYDVFVYNQNEGRILHPGEVVFGRVIDVNKEHTRAFVNPVRNSELPSNVSFPEDINRIFRKTN